MQKQLYGSRMKFGQTLTFAEKRRITDDSETYFGKTGIVQYRGITLVGECAGCGFKMNWNWGCPKCRK